MMRKSQQLDAAKSVIRKLTAHNDEMIPFDDSSASGQHNIALYKLTPEEVEIIAVATGYHGQLNGGRPYKLIEP
jgi:hypothetical protein